jgi:hypothetical membrane protein
VEKVAEETENQPVRLVGWLGIAGPLVVSAAVLSAILVSPWFNWSDNALSDLGVSGLGSTLFNTGLVAGGVMLIAFAAGLWKNSKSQCDRAGASILILGGVSLGAIGVFPENVGRIHLYFSVAFFASLALSLLTFSAARIVRAELRQGVFGGLLCVIATSVWLFEWRGVAIPETVAYLSGAAWWVTSGMKLTRNHKAQSAAK